MEINARVESEPVQNIPTFDSPALEMRYLEALESPNDLLVLNETLVKACEKVDFNLLKSLINTRKHPVLIFHAVKAVNSLLQSKSYEMLSFLTANNLDLSHVAFRGTIPRLVIMLAGAEEDFEKVIKIITESGLLIDDSEEESCSTGLHIACLRLDISLVRVLLKYKANPNPVNRFKLMPMNLVENEDCDEARTIKEILQNAGGQSKWNSYMD